MALVSFQRERKAMYDAQDFNVVVDDLLIAVVKNDELVKVEIPGGEHLLRVFVGKNCLAKYRLYIPDDREGIIIVLEATAAGWIEAFSVSDSVLRKLDGGRNNGYTPQKMSGGLLIFLIATCIIVVVTVATILFASMNAAGNDKSSIAPSQSTGISANDDSMPTLTPEKRIVDTKQKELLPEGGVFEKGSYVVVGDVEILYNGKSFEITNNSKHTVFVEYQVVGVKTDGTYEMLYAAAFFGKDPEQYDKDLKENGWAIMKNTNNIRVGNTLDAELKVYRFGGDFPDPDIDGDGYYDLVFTVHPQYDDDSLRVSTSDPESAVYKLKAK